MNNCENSSIRWSLSQKSDKNYKNSILWNVNEDKNIPHVDNLEMSGRLVSVVVEYGVDKNGNLVLSQNIVWPTLRTIPNNTHASLTQKYKEELIPTIKVNDVLLSYEKPYLFEFNGILTIKSNTNEKVEIIRTIFPSTQNNSSIERIELINKSKNTMKIDIGKISKNNSNISRRGCYGIYMLEVSQDLAGLVELEPNNSISFSLIFSGRKLLDSNKPVDTVKEQQKRIDFINNINNSLVLHTPSDIINQAFNFAKIRSAESIFDTKSGLMHCPGGLAFYAAMWTNDEAEYAGPFFPFLGDKQSIEASLNCYRMFKSFMGPDYRAIPSSIIAEGVDIWEGAGDRGDAAMYAYGASRFVLAMGDENIAKELWPAIKWCIEYCKRQINSNGVIASDSDELEGRFKTGNANLATSSLTYGALKSAANLARELGENDTADKYDIMSQKLYDSIENFFGANVSSFDTYRYYKENKVLRSWICLPLTVGIMKRKKGTIDALTSPLLWTDDGLLTESGDITYWDRSTLYAFRGIFNAGEINKTYKYFLDFSKRRILGEHVPYCVECYQSGLQLSGESALYCRVITEGIFGINPTGFTSFTCSPCIPDEWSSISLKNIMAFSNKFDICIKRLNNKYDITVTTKENKTCVYSCKCGDSVSIKL